MCRNFKKIISVLLILSLLAVCGCTKETDEPNVPTTDELIASQYNDLITDAGSETDAGKIIDYVRSWAEDNDISCDTASNGSLVMKFKASKGCDEYPSTALHCSISGTDNENEMQYLAVMMYAVTHLDKHGELSAIVSPADTKADIDRKYIKTDNFINLEYSEDDLSLLTSCAASSKYRLSHRINYTSPRYDTAYRITIKNLKGGKVSDLEEGHPNPLLNINSILANFKTNGLLYDLAKFKGGTSSDSYGTRASAVVVISRSDAESFEKCLDKAIAKFDKKWGDLEEGYEFSYEQTDMPSRVMTPESASDIVSLFYTMLSGVYLTDEDTDETVAYTNIGRLSIKNSIASVRIKAASKSYPTLTEMDDAVKTIAEISNFSYRKTSSSVLWKEYENRGLLGSFQFAADEITGNKIAEASTFETHLCGVLKDRNNSLSLLSFGLNYNHWDDAANTIIEFLEDITAADIVSQYFGAE